MAKKGVKLYILEVGQGMGHFVEIYSNGLDQKPTNTIVFDLGSEKGKKKYGFYAVGFIIKRLKEMATPKIDLITFSHGDKDHWNLFQSLIERCQISIPALKYGEVYYGGVKSQYNFGRNAYNILSDLQKKGATIQGAFPDSGSNFWKKDTSGNWPCMKDFDGFKVRLLLANVDEGVVLAVDQKTSNIFTNKNNVSAVIVCEYAGNRFIFPGDATGLTVNQINNLIEMQKIQDQVNNTHVLSVPHHGSAVTLAYGKDEYAPAKKFAHFCSANSIAASADFRTGFNHPNYDVLEIFCDRQQVVKPKALKIGHDGYTSPAKEKDYPKHLYTAYKGSDWHTFPTQDNIFTTAYTKSRAVDWIFTVDQDGAKQIERIPADALSDVSSDDPVLLALVRKRVPGSDIGPTPTKKRKRRRVVHNKRRNKRKIMGIAE